MTYRATSFAVLLALASAWTCAPGQEPASEPVVSNRPELVHKHRGVLLPIQDRVGAPELVRVVEEVLRTQLDGWYHLSSPEVVRDALRRERIRNAAAVDPRRLIPIANDLHAEWFLSVTLHRAVEKPYPEVILSGVAFRPGERAISWAGYQSGSGVDYRRVFMVGIIDDLKVLTSRVSYRLFEDMVGLEQIRGYPGRWNPYRVGYLRDPVPPDTIGTVAVVPFDSTTRFGSLENASIASALAVTALHRRGVDVTHPGIAIDIMRRRDIGRLGGLDRLSRVALKIGGDADWFVTGSVERFQVLGGANPNPWIELGAYLVHVESGRMQWVSTWELTGEETRGWFADGGVYSSGVLARKMIGAMMDGFLASTDATPSGATEKP